MKTTVNIFRTLLLAVLTLTFGACGEDSLLAELRLDGQTATKADGAGEVWDGTVATAFAGGSGTAEDPYQIANGAQLARFAAIVNGTDGMTQNTAACGKLTADILLNDTEGWENWGSTAPANTWTPIGSGSQSFTGTLDGDGHSVSGIYINSEADRKGLVGYLGSDGALQNLGVKASYIKGGYYVGGLCGDNNRGTVKNCYNTGSVAGTGSEAGGLCGYNDGGTVTNCYNTGKVTGNNSVGGVCGWNDMGSITNCYNTGKVTGRNDAGGVCGYNDGPVTNCYNTGSVTGSGYVGGLCGQNSATVTNCYYLDTCGAAGEGTSKTAGEFASGAVAYLLQNGQAEQIWGQNISFAPKDTYPVLGGLKVVQNGDGYANELNQNSDGFYLISTADELRLFASMVNGGQTNISAKLTADILLNDISDWENWNESTEGLNSWTPIGSGSQPFTGTLDGDGHSVSGIYINSEAECQGLVGYLDNGGTLQDLGVKASYIKGGNTVGGLCGWNYGTVSNCYNSGTVAGSQVGGVCGHNSGPVTNCYNTGNVAGDIQVGGVCGHNSGPVTNCYNTGNVAGDIQVGGVCGDNYIGTVTNCYNTGSVEGNNYVGGVCGYNYGDTVTNCYNTGNVAGDIQVGGVCGKNDQGTVTNCYYLTGTAAGGINGSDAAGQAEAKTKTEFQSGEVAWLLGEGWGQTIGTDDYPVLDADGTKRVYAVTLYQGSDAADARYLNSNGTFPTLTGNAIALVDADSPFKTGNGADFYTPVAFTATNATYTRTPSVWATNDGNGSGWETLCLPFSGTLYAGEEAKEPVDVASNNGAYWLRSLTGFETPNTLIFASPATAPCRAHRSAAKACRDRPSACAARM